MIAFFALALIARFLSNARELKTSLLLCAMFILLFRGLFGSEIVNL